MMKYSSFFDEWDLWLPQQEWENLLGESWAVIGAANAVPSLPLIPVVEPLPPPTPNDRAPLPYDGLYNTVLPSYHEPPAISLEHAIQEELHELYPEFHNKVKVLIGYTQWDYLVHWFGVHVKASAIQVGVDFTACASRLWTYFGEEQQRLPVDPLLLQTLAGWAWAVQQKEQDSLILKEVWDLHSQSEWFLPLLKHLQDHMHVQPVPNPKKNEWKWYFVKYKGDSSLPWTLAVHSVTVLFLIRQPDIKTSLSATNLLLRRGIKFVTVQERSPSFQSNSLQIPHPRNLVPYRRETDKAPTAADYGEYMYRVLDLLHQPHVVRAAMLTGGIIWRLMLEAIGREEDLYQMYLQLGAAGPTEDTSKHGTIFRTPRGILMDNVLSEEEKDIICGVYKVYTGTAFH